jgi:hypothetical protein
MRVGIVAVALLVAGCRGWSGAGPGCSLIQGPGPFPSELAETSGVAPSLLDENLFWTHSDDGGPATLWAVDGAGAVVGKVLLDDLRVFDAEDIESAPCAEGSCLYLGDIGDNYADRDTLFVHRLAEPDPRAGTVSARTLLVDLPDGPRDIEALFVLPEAGLFLVTKGSDEPVTVYRYPPPFRFDTLVTVVEVQRLSETARVLPRQVTGASATPDGSTVVVRTYETLLFFRWDGAALVPLPDTVNLRTLREAQGEGVGLGDDGLIVLTSEGGPAGGPASISVLRCDLG